jgi:hypothetical protein
MAILIERQTLRRERRFLVIASRDCGRGAAPEAHACVLTTHDANSFLRRVGSTVTGQVIALDGESPNE